MKEKLKMVMKGGKKVPAFAADGMGKMKKGGMADKAGRAMKKTSADAKGRAMIKGIYRDWETDRKSTRLNSSH